MAKVYPSVVKRPLRSWVFGQNTRMQLYLLIVVLVTVALRVLPLEMQKRIINEAINLRELDLLMFYCTIYLAAVIAASTLKYLINVIQTRISERTTASMRMALFRHLVTLPLTFYRNTQPGMVVNALVNELTIPGNFAGMAVAVPLTNMLTLLAFAAYLAWLNPLLAAISFSIYPIVLFLIPLLQRKVNKANKKRVDASRELSSSIAESIAGIHEIQGNGAFNIEARKFNRLVDGLMRIRIVWSLYRYAVKVTNNLFTNMGPFLVFILGGYLAIKGRLELGSLVAFLSAQEKLYTPWRELIEFYQVYQDGSVNYQRTMSYFDVAVEHEIEPSDRAPLALANTIDIDHLAYRTKANIYLLDDITMSLQSGEHMALVGFSGSGKSTLAHCICQLYKYSGGRLRIGSHEVDELTKRDIVENIGFVSQSPFIFNGTIEDNLLYAYAAQHDDDQAPNEKTKPKIDDMIAVLQQTGIFADVLHFGLKTVITSGQDEGLTAALLEVRHRFERDHRSQMSDWVEFFSQDQYLSFASVESNLIFGKPRNHPFDQIRRHKRLSSLRSFIVEAGLEPALLQLGVDIATRSADILKNLPPDDIFFEQVPFSPAELEDLKEIVRQLATQKVAQLSEKAKTQLIGFAMQFTPGRHKIAGLPPVLEERILQGRSLFRKYMSARQSDRIDFYSPDRYCHGLTIMDNILFGRLKTSSARTLETISQTIIQLLIQADLLETVVAMGLRYNVGIKGDNLSGGQRQKLAIARAFLKSPRILVMDEATSALDNRSQARIQNVIARRLRGKTTLLAVVHRLDIIEDFDRIGVMKAGKLVEMGTYQDLMDKKGVLYELKFGKR